MNARPKEVAIKDHRLQNEQTALAIAFEVREANSVVSNNAFDLGSRAVARLQQNYLGRSTLDDAQAKSASSALLEEIESVGTSTSNGNPDR